MDSFECEHPIKEDGVCISCGIVEENEQFDDSLFFRTISISKNYKSYKYSVKNQFKNYDAYISKILVPLRLENYREPIKKIIQNKKFNVRLSFENKIIVTLYHLLKQDDFPITIHDLLVYTNMPRSKILKAHRDSFEYKITSDNYLYGIYERSVDLLRRQGFTSTVPFEMFKEYYEQNTTCDPKALCVVCILENSNLPYALTDLKIGSQSFVERIKNIRKKIRTKPASQNLKQI